MLGRDPGDIRVLAGQVQRVSEGTEFDRVGAGAEYRAVLCLEPCEGSPGSISFRRLPTTGVGFETTDTVGWDETMMVPMVANRAVVYPLHSAQLGVAVVSAVSSNGWLCETLDISLAQVEEA
jgi:hypothetical protein